MGRVLQDNNAILPFLITSCYLSSLPIRDVSEFSLPDDENGQEAIEGVFNKILCYKLVLVLFNNSFNVDLKDGISP